MGLSLLTKRKWCRSIDQKIEFKQGNIECGWRDAMYVWPGQLPDGHRADLRALGHEQVFVVCSFGTPIAWWHPSEGWTVPRATYSRTTTHHQGVIADVVRNRNP
jgi:hypothetical protein